MATYLQNKRLWQARRTIKGKRVAFYGRTEAEAEGRANEACGSLSKTGPAPGTIEEFIGTTIAPLKAGRAEATRDQWVWAMDRYILPTIGHLRPDQLELRHCLEVLSKSREGRSAGTEHSVRKHLSPVVRLLARQRLIPYNYLEEIKSPDTSHREAVLTIGEAWKLAEGTDGIVRVLTLTTAFAGLRRGELMQIERRSIIDRVLLVRGKLKTKSSKREIPLPAAMEAMLMEESEGKAYMLAYGDGSQPRDDSLRKMLHRACDLLELPKCSPHSLRHTFATTMDSMGCPRGVLKGLMGHKAKDTTDIYVHPTMQAKRIWMESLWDARLNAPLSTYAITKGIQTPSTNGILPGSN